MTWSGPGSSPYPSEPRGLQPAPADIRAEASRPAQPVFAQPVPQPARRGSLVAVAVIGIVIASIALLLVGAYFLLALGPGLTVFGAVLALVPLGIVLAGIRWIDRWEPEPRPALAFGFLWGAGVSVVIALVFDLGVQITFSSAGVDSNSAGVQFLQAAVQAPLVEETAKGLAILLLFLSARRHFDGPVDGVVYAAITAAGFAFTENILYFGSQLATAGGVDASVVSIFFVRGILSPFAHVMFTSMTGIAVGYAAARWPSVLPGIGFFLLGLVPAVLLHALWNGALFFVSDFFGYYFVVQVPLFVLAIVLVSALRRRERRITQARLTEYAAAGWINIDEVPTLATPAGRRVARGWAARHGLGEVMQRYIRDATRLAFARQRIVIGRDRIGAQADEAELLGSITQARRVLLGTPQRG